MMIEKNFKPLVSICVTAYNIEKYIAECLDSILNQKHNFIYEIVVGEDCSSDDTPKILKKYNSLYPGLFNIQYNEKNLGMMNNFHSTLNRCRGKYIAIMDGDDVWVDENKLQLQINFLINNQDYILSFHDSSICDSNLKQITTYKTRFPERFNFFSNGSHPSQDQIVKWKGILGATSSIVFRNPFKSFPDWIINLYGLEPMIFTLLYPYGKYKYFDKSMSIYRVHSNSTDKSFSQLNKAERNIREYNTYKIFFKPLYFRFYQKKIISNRIYIIYKSLFRGMFFNSIKNSYLLINDFLSFLFLL